MGMEFRTEIKPKTLNPLWNVRKYKDLPIAINREKLETVPPIIIKVYDHDAMSSDDYLGIAIIDFKDWVDKDHIRFDE